MFGEGHDRGDALRGLGFGDGFHDFGGDFQHAHVARRAFARFAEGDEEAILGLAFAEEFAADEEGAR
ncbi:MAG: hypothetical protein U0232_25785 [Thermomicrobiales bacterium]